MTTLRRLAFILILATVALAGLITPCSAISYLPPDTPDPNQAFVADLQVHVSQLASQVDVYGAMFGWTAYWVGQNDGNFACWSLIQNELAAPTTGNLWDIATSVAVAEGNVQLEINATGAPYWQGYLAELESVMYWVNWEMSQPGVVVP